MGGTNTGVMGCAPVHLQYACFAASLAHATHTQPGSLLGQQAKAFAAGVSEVEFKVLEATNEDKWGPHGSAMQEIAREAEDPEKFPLAMVGTVSLLGRKCANG